jgi:tRNA dimethylallyltransferase
VSSPFDGCWVLTGPTGSGKSAAALAIAKSAGCEIVAMDSMTLYRGMDIGTAKPTAAERAAVPHHLIDLFLPTESASVAVWRERSAAACGEIRGRGRQPLFVGGTPFYFMAIRSGLFDAPPADEAIRTRLDREADENGLPALHRRLSVADPAAAVRIHVNDRKRIVRALEVFESTGRPISEHQQSWDSPAFGRGGERAELTVVRIDWPRDELYRRIDERVRAMLAAGWRDECERLLGLPRPLSREAEKAIGYRELFDAILADRPTDAALEATIAMRTRQFAKRQLTWFRRFPEMHVVDAMAGNIVEAVRRRFST